MEKELDCLVIEIMIKIYLFVKVYEYNYVCID